VFGTSLPKNNVLDQNWRGSWLEQHIKKHWDPLRIFATVEASNFKFGTQLGFETSYQKRFVPKLAGFWAKGASKKLGNPYVFLQELKLAISNLVQKFGMGLAYQKTAIRTKIGGVLARGASQKMEPPTYFCNH